MAAGKLTGAKTGLDVGVPIADCPLGCPAGGRCEFLVFEARQKCLPRLPAPGKTAAVVCQGFGHKCGVCHGVCKVISRKKEEYSRLRFDEAGDAWTAEAAKAMLLCATHFPKNWSGRCQCQ